MAKDKVFTPEVIEEVPFPTDTSELLGSNSNSPTKSGVYSPATTKSSTTRPRRTATQLMSVALNTRSRKILQEFELQQSGGFKIGDYQDGENGDIRITPSGIVARNSSGITTFALDGTDGSAVFKGTVQAGSVIAATILADLIVGGTLTLSDDGVNLIVESGELQINAGADIVLSANESNSGKSIFRRSDKAEEAIITLSETWGGGVPVESSLILDPDASNTMGLWFGNNYNWKNIYSNTTGNFNINCNTFTINSGTPKTAIGPTNSGYKALYTNESPDLWFVDFGKINKKWWQFWKKLIITVDSLFLEVTSPPYHIIPTINKKVVQVWGKRKGFENIRFESKTKEEFEKNNKFWNQSNIK